MKRVGKSCLLHSDLFELCRREAEAKEKESARVTMGREKRGKEAFPCLFLLPIVHRALSISRLLQFLLGSMAQYELLWRGE